MLPLRVLGQDLPLLRAALGRSGLIDRTVDRTCPVTRSA